MPNNKKTKPAAGKSAAGKSNSKKNNVQKEKQKQRAEAEKRAQRLNEEKQRQRLEAEKRAQKLIEDKQKAQRQQQKKSEEIHKRRAKENEREQKNQQKLQQKNLRRDQRRNSRLKVKKIIKKLKYYTSREFLSSFNYGRIFVFIVLPVALIVFGIISFMKSVPMNVPAAVRNYEFNGRIESELTAQPSMFTRQQQKVFMKTFDPHGSRKFDFYINSVVEVDDDGCTTNLCFGNPKGSDCILIATIFGEDRKIIYRSLGLESDREINKAKLFESLKYGLHDVTVSVNAYDKKTNEKIGTKYAKIRLAVGVDEDG